MLTLLTTYLALQIPLGILIGNFFASGEDNDLRDTGQWGDGEPRHHSLAIPGGTQEQPDNGVPHRDITPLLARAIAQGRPLGMFDTEASERSTASSVLG